MNATELRGLDLHGKCATVSHLFTHVCVTGGFTNNEIQYADLISTTAELLISGGALLTKPEDVYIKQEILLIFL